MKWLCENCKSINASGAFECHNCKQPASLQSISTTNQATAMNDEKKFPPRVWIWNGDFDFAKDNNPGKVKLINAMNWDYSCNGQECFEVMSVEEHEAILSEERARLEEAVAVIKESDEYLTRQDSISNFIGTGSILHRKFKSVLEKK